MSSYLLEFVTCFFFQKLAKMFIMIVRFTSLTVSTTLTKILSAYTAKRPVTFVLKVLISLIYYP